MIYVVLGLAILAVSFVVALVSLVREQNLVAKKTTGDVVPSDADKKDLEQAPEGVSEVALKDDRQVEVKRELFPWELEDQRDEEPKDEERQTFDSDKSTKLEGEFYVSKIAGKSER